MTHNSKKNALQNFALLPKPHRLGLIVLCGLLVALGLNRAQNNEEESIPSHSSSILATSAYATPLTDTANAPWSNAENFSPMTQLPGEALDSVAQALTSQVEESPLNTNTNLLVSVKDGDTLAAVFSRADINKKYMYHLLHNHPKAEALAKIFPGHQLKFVLNDDNKLIALHHIKSALKEDVFTRTESGYEYASIARSPEIRLVRTEGTITHSLYGAAKQAQLEDKLTMSLASIFGWDVDFALDIRENDRFIVVYEEKYLDNKRLGTGNIIAAEFVNKNNSYKAVRYIDTEGNAEYYTPKGRNMRKAFLRAPVDFRRISSNFNPKRLHPVTKTVRPHRGIDYAANTGTPVWSSGDGKVLASGYSKYNGNYVVIQHSNNIQTKYLHLHKRKVKKGQRVRQKQLIGTVGTTGLSTAPHLHYEFLLNGVHRNPRTIVSKLPKANPVPKAERARFFAQTKNSIAQLNNLPNATQIAKQETGSTPINTTTAM